MRSTIEMAREAGFYATRGWGLLPHVPEDIFIANVCVTEEVNRLVELARADERERIADESKHIIKRAEARGAAVEREACAKVCEDQKYMILEPLRTYSAHDICDANKRTALYLSKVIRARGETK